MCLSRQSVSVCEWHVRGWWVEEVGLWMGIRQTTVCRYGKEYVRLLATETFQFAYLRCVPTGLGLFGTFSSIAVCRFPDAVQDIVRGDGPRRHYQRAKRAGLQPSWDEKVHTGHL